MTQISLSKVYALIDEERGRLLHERKEWRKGAAEANADPTDTDVNVEHCLVNAKRCSDKLRLLNKLKKEFALVSDADQLPLGL